MTGQGRLPPASPEVIFRSERVWSPQVAGAADPVEVCHPEERTGPRRSGGGFLAKSLGQVADLGFWVAAVTAQGLQEG
jgi:hypothetical protein